MSLSNPSLAAFLLDNGPRCISVAYDRTLDRKGDSLPVDVKSFKSFDTTLAKGDYVVIPTDTRWGFTVGRVEAVDVQVNYDSHEIMRWIAGKVDKEAYESILEQEKGLVQKVSQAREQKAKRELADELKTLDPNIGGFMLNAPARMGGAEPAARGGAQERDFRTRTPPQYPDEF